jgi:hypothetical protein
MPACRAPRSTIRAAPIRSEEDRAVEAVDDDQVDRPGRSRGHGDGDDLAAFAEHRQGAVAAFDAEGADVRTEGFGDPQNPTIK